MNLIYGENGSGKSSLLEAVGYLGLGRSFRVNRHEAVARHGNAEFTVFGITGNGNAGGSEQLHRVGFSRHLGNKETRLRVDGDAVKTLSALACHLPVSVIEPGTFDIVAGGPVARRQFLDWAVFHVEHRFAGLWQQCQRIISQRNQILRNGKLDPGLLRVWDRQYVPLAQEVHSIRAAVFEGFREELSGLIAATGNDARWGEALKIDLYHGWDVSRDLAELLQQNQASEFKMGHTLYGPNRADIRLRMHARPVAETLSRGQQKTLVILMKVAQGLLLKRHGKQVTFLLDDISAELDAEHRRMLAECLSELGCQVFITSIERPQPQDWWRDTTTPVFKMFHVEHGELTEE